MSSNTIEDNAAKLIQRMHDKVAGRVTAKWQSIRDVDWDDLDHFIANCKRLRDKDSFDTAIVILQTLREQVLTRK